MVIENVSVRSVMSSIEWTDATWNPATGCSKVSPGCKNCYAEKMSARLKAMGQEKYKNNFEYTEHPDSLNTPLKWKKPRMIFVNSMSDLFHENATDDFITAVFDTMLLANHHTYQILTKRPKRMMDFVSRYNLSKNIDEIPKHIWLGTSVENQDYDFRIDILRAVKCRVKFVSFEPLLGNINPFLKGIDWAIVGGESGSNSRPIYYDWIKNIQKSCEKYNTAFFFKQWGGTNKKKSGAELDGKKYQEFPKID